MERLKALAWSILILIICLCIQLGAVFVYAITTALGAFLEPQNKGMGWNELMDHVIYRTENIENATYVMVAAALIIALIFGFWYFRRPLDKEKARKPMTKLPVRLVCVTGIALALLLLIGGALNFIQLIWPNLMEGYMDTMESLDLTGSILMVVYVVVLGPISEELAFRGVIYRVCRKRTDYPTANFIQSLLFAVYHLNLIQGLYTFVMGIFLGMTVEKGKSLVYCIWMHIVFNAISSAIAFVTIEDVSAYVLLAAMIAAVPILLVSIKGFLTCSPKEKSVV